MSNTKILSRKAKIKKILCVTAVFALLIALTVDLSGCSVTYLEAADLMEGITPREHEMKAVTVEEAEKVTDFAVRLLKASHGKGENTLVSPLSVLSALSMTANGAKGNTLTEMEEVLGMPLNELNEYFYAYERSLPSADTYKLHLANSVWFTSDSRFTVNNAFLQTNADYYGAEAFRVPFDDTTVKDINKWVKNHTDDMIPEILNEIPGNAVMYLVNALAFEAEWEEIYQKSKIRKGTFNEFDGEKETVDFMSSSEKYFESENAKGFIKYYKDRKYAFAALLPNEDIGIDEYIASLDGASLRKMLCSTEEYEMTVNLPKFECSFDIDMSETLVSMGIKDAFNDAKADLTGLGRVEAGNLYVSRVLHKTYISVDAKGTKAGAATSAEISNKAALNFEVLTFDRPFVYMLIDCETNTPFFIGSLLEID